MATILLVEDDNNLREIYEARLAAEGYTIVAAQNGEEALVLAKQKRPDLIISDVMMPRISGYEMLDILRNTDELRDTKVIMLTALGQAEDKDRAGKLGADKYLVKSQVTLEDIVNSAKALLGDTAPQPPAVALTSDIPAAASPVETPTEPVSPTGASVATPSTPPSLAPVEEPQTLNTSVPVAALPVPNAVTPQADPGTMYAPSTAIDPPADTPTSTPFDITTPGQAVEPPASVGQFVPTDPAPLVTSAPAVTESPSPATTTSVNPPSDNTTPVTVDEVIAAQPDANGEIEAPSAVVADVKNTPLGDTNLPTGEPTTLATEEAALEAQMKALSDDIATAAPQQTEVNPPEAVDSAASLTDSATNTAVDNDTVFPQALESLAVEPTEAPAATPLTEQSPTEASNLEQSTTSSSVVSPAIPPGPPPVQVSDDSEEPDYDQVTVVGKKVIQPINDPHAKPDINALLAAEEAKGIVATQPSPVVIDSAALPQHDEQISPTASEQPENPVEKPAPRVIDPSQPDPNSVAL